MSTAGLSIIAFEPVSPAILGGFAVALGESLRRDAAVSGTLMVPKVALDDKRGQYRSRALMSELASWRSRQGVAGFVLGVTDRDIFIPGLNFIFGEADRGDDVALVSLARLGPRGLRGDPTVEARLLKESVHELGHLLGLDHCRRRTCIMYYSNTIEDTDAKGPGFCGDCQASNIWL